MPAPSQGSELHVDVPLSNVVVGRRPQGFIADQLLPVTPVSKQSDLYYKFNHREWFLFQQGLDERAPGTEAKKVVMSVSSDSYFARNYALGAELVVEDAVNADEVLQWRTAQAEHLTDRLLMSYEMRVAALAQAATSVATTTTVASGWTDPVNSRAFDDIENEKEAFRLATGRKPNTLIIPQAAWLLIRKNENLRARVFGTNNGGVITREQFANLIEIPNVLVPFAQVNTAGEQETFIGSSTLSDVWGNDLIFADINLLQGRQIDTWINAFRWTSPMLGVPWAVQAYPFDAKKKKFEIEVGYYQVEKIVSRDLARKLDVTP